MAGAPLTVAALLARARAALAAAPGLTDPGAEARFLLGRLLGRPPIWLLGHGDEPIGAEIVARLEEWTRRRAAGEPAHYIAGACPFWGREYLVGPGVLIPRPETELLVARALALPLPAHPRVLDVGTGSGCIAITLALELGVRAVATDLSLPALATARANAGRLGAELALVAADLATPLAGAFDLVVANLPYLPAAELDALAVEVRGHEPHGALIGGATGSELPLRLRDELPRLLAPGGHALLELGPGQAAELAAGAESLGLAEVDRVPDLLGVDRVLVLRRAYVEG